MNDDDAVVGSRVIRLVSEAIPSVDADKCRQPACKHGDVKLLSHSSIAMPEAMMFCWSSGIPKCVYLSGIVLDLALANSFTAALNENQETAVLTFMSLDKSTSAKYPHKPRQNNAFLTKKIRKWH